MTRCAQPGCAGALVDGYCDICGLAPVGGAPRVPERAPRPESSFDGGSAWSFDGGSGGSGGSSGSADGSVSGSGWNFTSAPDGASFGGYGSVPGSGPSSGSSSAPAGGSGVSGVSGSGGRYAAGSSGGFLSPGSTPPVPGPPPASLSSTEGDASLGHTPTVGITPPAGGISSGGSGPPPGTGPTGPTAPTGPTSGGGPSISIGSGSANLGGGSRGDAMSAGTRTGRSSRRGMLGAGLVDVPPVPYRDPSTAVLDDPEVAEKRRFCSNCGEPVGRSQAGRAGRAEGFCRQCGTGFSFTPKLWPGDLVGGQYEVLGCLAHGGLGWIYLARDRNVNNRWVVLKGLLDTGDAAAMASAATERAFLAEVEHPNIVKIYNFVQHPDPRTQAMVGYIVMEYVGGRSLKEIVLDHRKSTSTDFPLGQILAYALEALRALGYLHSKGLLFCDFKPDNAIQSEEQLKLIDLGGVRRMADGDSPIYGTLGYQAPEIGKDGPSISSDLYTVGRTLAVLSFQFRGFTGAYADALPPRDQVPVLMRHESYYRLLRRAVHKDRAVRFGDAEEMATQLTGVLREVLATEDGAERPAQSTLFGPERQVAGTELREPEELLSRGAPAVFRRLDPVEATTALPVPGGYGADPAADLTGEDLANLVTALSTIQYPTAGDRLLEVRVRIARREVAQAAAVLDRVERPEELGWWGQWFHGLVRLAGGDYEEAAALFDGMYDLMPGEAAPKLALAFCAECQADQEAAAGDYEAVVRHRATAAAYYERVWRTDHAYVSAAFGLARVRLASGDRPGAADVLDAVPKTSSHRIDAQVAAVAAAVRGRTATELAEADLVAAGNRLQVLGLDARRHGRLAAELLEAALAWRLGPPVGTALPAPDAAGARPGGAATLLGSDLEERALRGALERAYRELARQAETEDDRHTLVTRANAVRPKTLW
jgi:serine/threonine-protein kinase PknG